MKIKMVLLTLVSLFCFCHLSYAVDCGLRVYDGVSIHVVNCEDIVTTTSSLRVRDPQGGMWGLMLVELSDPYATNVQVAYTDSSGARVAKALGRTDMIGLHSCEEVQLVGFLQSRFPNQGVKYYLPHDIDCSATNPSNPSYQNSFWQLGYTAYYTKNGVPLGFDGVANSGDETVPELTADAGQSGWIPIGWWSNNRAIMVEFDGQGFAIKNVYANRAPGNYGDFGFFGCTRDAIIKNLHLRNVTVGDNMRVGGLIGVAENTQVINCSVEGTVFADRGSVGGLIGQCGGFWIAGNWGEGNCSVEDSYFRGTITMNDPESDVNGAGGLVGYGQDLTINRSFFEGAIYGYTARYSPSVGGLVGYGNDNTNVADSFSIGTITPAVGSYSGGLIGFHKSGTVANSWWFGSTSKGIGYFPDGIGKKVSSATEFNGTGSGSGLLLYQNWDFYDAETNPEGLWAAEADRLPHHQCNSNKTWDSDARVCQ